MEFAGVLRPTNFNDGRFIDRTYLGYGGHFSGDVKPGWFGWAKDDFLFSFIAGEAIGNDSSGGWALSVPLSAFEAPIWIPYRRMQFVRQRTLSAIDPVLALTATVVLAVLGAGYWSLVLGATLGSISSTALSGDPFKLWSLGGSVLAPIFDGGRLQAQVRASDARRRPARAGSS